MLALLAVMSVLVAAVPTDAQNDFRPGRGREMGRGPRPDVRADDEVADGIPIAAAALTVLINKQADGYSYLPAQ
jgi:hypothetical protein